MPQGQGQQVMESASRQHVVPQGQRVVTNLTSKLNVQAERILKWKMQAEVELKKRDEKLKQYESNLKKVHANLLSQQMHSEKISQRLQSELMIKGELKGKIENTRQICSLLQEHSHHLSSILKRCLDEKVQLKTVYDEQLMNADDLAQRFQSLLDYNIPEVEKLKSMVIEERRDRINTYNEARSLKANFEQRLESLAAILKAEKAKAEQLDKQLVMCKKKIQQLCNEKEAKKLELEQVKQRLVDLEKSLTQEKEILKRELEQTQNLLVEEKHRVESLKVHGEQILAKLQEVVKSREEAYTDNLLKKENIEQLSANLVEKNNEIEEMLSKVSELSAEKTALEEKVLELEPLRQAFAELQISLDTTLGQKQEGELQLEKATEKIEQLQSAVATNEKLLAECEQERDASSEQVKRLEAIKLQLDTKLMEANQLIGQLSDDIKQLEKTVQDKQEEMEILQADLDSLAKNSESELLDNQKNAEELKFANNQLQQQIDTCFESMDEFKTKIHSLEADLGQMRETMSQEQKRSAMLTTQLQEREHELEEARTKLTEQQTELARLMEQLDRGNKEKLQLETRINNLLGENTKLSLEKNQALSEASCSLRDKQMLEAETDIKLQETAAVFERYRTECESLSRQHKDACERHEQELEAVRKEKADLEEQLSKTDQHLSDTIAKLKEQANKNELKKKRMLEKINHQEKKLRVKDQEMKDLKVYKKTPSIHSPSTDSSRTPPPPHKPFFGMPVTPKMLSAQSAEPTRSILKTPMTPMTRKRVMFQEESSDTDASAVDIMVIDEKEVHRRMEALKRGEKVNSRPLHVLKSPSKPVKRQDNNTPTPTKPEQSTPVFGKKPRFVDDSSAMQTTPTKSKNYIDFETAFGFDD